MRRGRRRVAVVAAAGAVAASALVAAGPALAGPGDGVATYIVRLKAQPVAAYDGGVAGIPATAPALTGTRESLHSQAAERYSRYLDAQQDRALSGLRGTALPRVIYSYRTALAGFAVRVTADQAAQLAKAPGVAAVSRDRLLRVQRRRGHDWNAWWRDPGRLIRGDGAEYLNLTSGLWTRLGGPTRAGDGVVVGVLDTGITPDHPSFSDSPLAGGVLTFLGPSYGPPPAAWNGACDVGADTSFHCNNKLIGARYFLDGFGAANLNANAVQSPRDDDGHGSHTASTAAGNFGVDPSIAGNDLGQNLISGIAPRARVAMYKVCWPGPTTDDDGCASSDSAAAIDAAVSDGVDVINMSLGSDADAVFDGNEGLSLLVADLAGVFVSNSAGNAGPAPDTVGYPAQLPWVTGVAASTLDRTFEATATITAGTTTLKVTGASVTPALPATPLVDAQAAALPGAAPADAARCFAGTLDPAMVAGKAVVCRRGVTARVEKGKVVKDAGGVGMILYNAAPNQETVTDNHWVPTVHVTFEDGQKVLAAMASAPGDATVSLTAGRAAPTRGDVMAAFSSRGPQGGVPDVLKPDVTAPGVNILAAASPLTAHEENVDGERFQSISGTSMSAPHVAGAAALLRQAHPDWSPERIKSALMTTAAQGVVQEDGATPATPFDDGAGRIDPNRAADPGLVLDTGGVEYLAYLEGQIPGITELLVGQTVPPIPATDLNLPSIAMSDLVFSETTVRQFTSTDRGFSRWRVSVEGLPGFDVQASPSRFVTFGRDQVVPVEVRVTRTTAPLHEYGSGALVLRDGRRTLRLPIVVEPTDLRAPDTVAAVATSDAGTQPFAVTPGYTGTLDATGSGLATPVTHTGTIAKGEQYVAPVTVDAGTRVVGGEIYFGATPPAGLDLDLFLYKDDGSTPGAVDPDDTLVALSATGSAAEFLAVADPDPGQYLLVVDGFAVPAGGAEYNLDRWLVTDPSPDDPSNEPGIEVTGDGPVTAGQDLPLDLRWQGVAAPGRYLGIVDYANAGPVIAQSLVVVDRSLSQGGGAPAPAAVRSAKPSLTPRAVAPAKAGVVPDGPQG